MSALHVMRHGAPMKGRRVIGMAPLSGCPRDLEGRLILDWIYGEAPAPVLQSEPEPIVKRGPIAASQGHLRL